MTLKLTYFGLPAKAEASRVMLAVSGLPHEDNRIDFKDWPALKSSTPFGQLPFLEHDGKTLAQTAAIDRYVARLTGMHPTDTWQAALADQMYAFLWEDVWGVFVPTMRMQDPEEKKKAREDVCSGPLKEKFEKLTALLEARTTKFVAGDSLSYADVTFFVIMSLLQSGWLDGVSTDLLKDYPVLKAFRNQVASVEGVKKYYENETEGLRVAFKPDA